MAQQIVDANTSEIAQVTARRPLHLLPDDDVEAEEGDGGAQPFQRWHALMAGDRGQQRDNDRRGAEDQRSVADAGAFDAAEEQELVQAVTDYAQEDETRPVGPGQRRRRSGAVLPGRASLPPQRGEEDGRGDGETERVERQFREVPKGDLDEREIGPPDGDHREEQEVEAGHGWADVQSSEFSIAPKRRVRAADWPPHSPSLNLELLNSDRTRFVT